jgi:hypothetical protein
MSDFNPLDRAKVAVHRSSFDLSSKKLFTAKWYQGQDIA